MDKVKVTKMSDYFDFEYEGTQRRLRTYYHMQQSGYPFIVKTGMGKRVNIAATLRSWARELSTLQKSEVFKKLYDYEIECMAKVGPMSYMVPLKERVPKIVEYYELSDSPNSSDILDDSIALTVDEFRPIAGLRLKSQPAVIENMRLNTNSGNPYFTKRNKALDMVRSDLGIVDGWVRSDYIYRPVACVGWRGQEGGPEVTDVKQRVVWMFPFELNVLELQMYQPIIEGSQNQGLVPAWISNEAVDVRMTRLFETAGDEIIVCTDFAGFDQHFGPAMQLAAGKVISGLSTGQAEQDWLTNVFPIKYEIPMLLNDEGWMLTGKHGMASGSGGTNVDETLAHRSLQWEAALRLDAELNTNSMCLGDDGVLSYKGINVEQVTQSYTSHGLEMQTSKQYVSREDTIFLRRWHHREYAIKGVNVGVYPTMRALGRLMYQERYQDDDAWDAKAVALRTLSILENTKWHPMFEEFVRFVMKRDKYRICLDIPFFFDDIESIVEEKTTLMPEILGYNQSQMNPVGIRDWRVFQFLRSLR